MIMLFNRTRVGRSENEILNQRMPAWSVQFNTESGSPSVLITTLETVIRDRPVILSRRNTRLPAPVIANPYRFYPLQQGDSEHPLFTQIARKFQEHMGSEVRSFIANLGDVIAQSHALQWRRGPEDRPLGGEFTFGGEKGSFHRTWIRNSQKEIGIDRCIEGFVGELVCAPLPGQFSLFVRELESGIEGFAAYRREQYIDKIRLSRPDVEAALTCIRRHLKTCGDRLPS